MTAYYCDFNTGLDTNTGLSWAQAFKTWETLIAFVANDSNQGYYRESGVADTKATNRTIQTNGPVFAVKSGTTNEPPVASDFCVRGTDTLPIVEVTGTATITLGTCLGVHGMHFRVAGTGGLIQFAFNDSKLWFRGCIIDAGASGTWRITPNGSGYLTLWDCAVSGNGFRQYEPGRFEMIGGTLSISNSSYIIGTDSDGGDMEFRGVDMRGSTATAIFQGGSQGGGRNRVINCILPVGWTPASSGNSVAACVYEFIGSSSDVAAKANDSSIQDYAAHLEFGDMENEAVAVRTDGANDGASGAFSWALTPIAFRTAEGASHLISPWIYRWIPGGAAKTLTVHIANSGAADYKRDEAYMELLTVSASDLPQPDLQLEDGGPAEVYLPNATDIQDDTDSVWGSGANNPQKFEHSVTPGFEGWAMARVHFNKRFTSTPETLYVDPFIKVA
jgi:hypothetical protein